MARAAQHSQRKAPSARGRARRPLGNAEIARALRELSVLLEIDGVPFKPRAYEKAAYAVEGMSRSLEEILRESGLAGLDAIPSVGRGIAERIAQLCRTGRIDDLETLRAKYPVDVLGLTSVEGMGPKSVRVLWEQLGIQDVAGLKRAAETGQLHELTHFGDQRERKLLAAVGVYETLHGRWPLGQVLELAESIERRLRRVRGVHECAVAGSVRRRKETIGDLDFLVASAAPETVMEAFGRLAEVAQIHARGSTKSSVRLEPGIDADLRVVPIESFGAALQYFTGSKDHNLALRRIAQKKGYKLSEYGLFEGERTIAGSTEQEIYSALGLPWIAPELRENAGELEAAMARRLPELIEPGSLRGDLQVHTSWTDGRDSLERMVLAAKDAGLDYVAITDHTRDLAMARGLDEIRLREQLAEIRALERRIGGIRVLAGAEVNIRPDGSLDIADEMLDELDFVGAAVHASLEQPRAQMTRRLLRAIAHPRVDALFHPMGRSLGRRRGVDADFDAVIAAAQRTGTALEIDAQPERLDLGSELVRRAVAARVPLLISSDAHGAIELRYAEAFGISVARRGWATAGDVLNTLPLRELSRNLKRAHTRAARRHGA